MIHKTLSQRERRWQRGKEGKRKEKGEEEEGKEERWRKEEGREERKISSFKKSLRGLER